MTAVSSRPQGVAFTVPRLQHHQCVSNEDIAVFHLAIEVLYYVPNWTDNIKAFSL